MKDQSEKRVTISISVKPETVTALAAYAKKNERSVSYAADFLINKALKNNS